MWMYGGGGPFNAIFRLFCCLWWITERAGQHGGLHSWDGGACVATGPLCSVEKVVSITHFPANLHFPEFIFSGFVWGSSLCRISCYSPLCFCIVSAPKNRQLQINFRCWNLIHNFTKSSWTIMIYCTFSPVWPLQWSCTYQFLFNKRALSPLVNLVVYCHLS